MTDDYGYFGKGLEGYAHYMQSFHARAFALWATGVDLAPVYIARKDLTPADAKAADISTLELV